MALISISASKCVFADDSVTKDAVFQTVIEDFLTLTLDDTNMVVETSMTKTFGSGYVIASVGTNNAYGYTLSMQDSDDRNGLERDGFATASEENKSKYNIPSVTSDTAYANLADDSWGYFLGSTAADQATYKQIPFEATEILSSDSNTSGLETARVNFGVKTAEFRPSGLYEDEISFTLVANMGPISLEQAYAANNKSKVTVSGNQYYTIQDMTPGICAAATEVSSNLQVVDIRDNTIYWIGKLADNRCWLLDNLALDPLAENVIVDDTNTNASAAAITNYLVNSTAPYSGWAAETLSYSDNTHVYEFPRINSDSKDAPPAKDDRVNDPLEDEVAVGGWKVGVYYNACAASVGTYCYEEDEGVDKVDTPFDIEYDICPAGWRIPTGGELSGEYATLFKSIAGYESDDYDEEPAYSNIRRALRMPLSGNFFNGEARNQGNYTMVWSATYYDESYMYIISPDSGSVPWDIMTRSDVNVVRCIAKTGTEPAPSGN